MNKVFQFSVRTLVAGVLIVAPAYLAGLLLLKAMKSLGAVVGPFSHLLPKWLPAEEILSLLLVLCVCFLIGLALNTQTGNLVVAKVENSVSGIVPGYELFRGLTQRLAGNAEGSTWKPALVEIEEALVPAFIIEELEDGSFTVFVPSVPTPLAGAVYILTHDRVHPLDIPLTQAIKTVSRWGAGSKDLLAALGKKKTPQVHAFRRGS
jgi:uncharacterized membrane protein